MNSFAIVLTSFALALSQPSVRSPNLPPSTTSGTQPTTALVGQAPASSSGLRETLPLLAASLTWAIIWIQLVIIPFYNKGELLHKDYWASGRINSTLAAIEADQLIPSLARMFSLAAARQTDKRKRPEKEMEDLLQSVEFLPELGIAQDASITMDGIRQQYRRLRLLASRLWKTGLVHTIISPAIPVVHSFLVPLDIRWQ